MRAQLVTLLFFAVATIAQAQNNVIVFAEQGELFTLYVNGVKQNDSPVANVHAKDLTGEGVALRVVFADEAEQPLTKNITFFNKNTEVTAKITMTKKGYRLKYFGEAAIGTSPEPVVDTDPVIIEDEAEFVSVPVTDASISSTTTTTTVEETTMSTNVDVVEDGDSESVSMQVGVDGFNFNMNVNVNGDGDGVDVDQSQTTTSTTTTTTTTSSQGVVVDDAQIQDHSVVIIEEDPCMKSTRDIAPLKSAMEGETFSDDKMNVAKQALREACVYVDGIKELAALFTYEDDRFEFVKYCYDRCADTENYYLLNAVFTYSSTKDDLNDFLESK